MPALPTRCMHGQRCQVMRTELEFFECAAFPPNALAPKRARHLVQLVTDAWGLRGIADTVIEVASELTTNALRYGRLAVRVDVRVYVEHGQLVFEVEDRSPQRPTPKPLGAARNSGTGFGLQIVADTVDDWGYEYFNTDHKRVWAAFDLPDTRRRPSGGSSTMNSTAAPKATYPGDRRTWTLSGEPGCSPTLTDVRGWCKGTITGPWGLTIDAARAADCALTGMMPPEIDPAEPVTVRLFRVLAGGVTVVTVIVDDEMVQLEPMSLAAPYRAPLVSV